MRRSFFLQTSVVVLGATTASVVGEKINNVQACFFCNVFCALVALKEYICGFMGTKQNLDFFKTTFGGDIIPGLREEEKDPDSDSSNDGDFLDNIEDTELHDEKALNRVNMHRAANFFGGIWKFNRVAKVYKQVMDKTVGGRFFNYGNVVLFYGMFRCIIQNDLETYLGNKIEDIALTLCYNGYGNCEYEINFDIDIEREKFERKLSEWVKNLEDSALKDLVVNFLERVSKVRKSAAIFCCDEKETSINSEITNRN